MTWNKVFLAVLGLLAALGGCAAPISFSQGERQYDPLLVVAARADAERFRQ